MPDSPAALRLVEATSERTSGGDLEAFPLGLDDIGNGKRFARDWQDIARYCFELEGGCWLVYDGGRWKKDNTGMVQRMAKETATGIKDEPLLKEENRDKVLQHAHYSRQGKGLREMLSMARSEPGIHCVTAEFDRDPLLLNVLDGTIELRPSQEADGRSPTVREGSEAAIDASDSQRQTEVCRTTWHFREHRVEDMLMQQIPVRFNDPERHTNDWLPFITKVMPDEELRLFLQRFAGLCLSGDVSDEAIFFFIGPAGTGKGTFLSTMQALLGDDLSVPLPVEYFLSSKYDKLPIHIHAAKGKRLVVVSENEKNAKFNAATIKMWTGDKRSGKGMRENLSSSEATDKLVFQSNHLPQFNDTSAGIKRRAKITSFKVVIPDSEIDRRLKERLRTPAALSGLLHWALEGWDAWVAQGGLNTPESVKEVTSDLLALQDQIASFINDVCERDPLGELDKKELYDHYRRWCEDNGEGKPMSNRRFVPAIREQGFCEGHSNDRSYWLALRLKDTFNYGGPSESENRKRSKRIAEEDERFK